MSFFWSFLNILELGFYALFSASLVVTQQGWAQMERGESFYALFSASLVVTETEDGTMSFSFVSMRSLALLWL